MKKSLKVLTTTFLMLFLICFCSVIPVKAASSSTSKQWATAYMKIIKKANKEDKARKKSAYFANEPYKYALIYFNNDSIPELVVGNTGYWVSMYTYDKKTKKVYAVMDQWAYGAGGNAGYMYLPKKNCLYNIDNDMAGAIQYLYYGKMKNHKIVDRNSKSLCIYNFNDKNKNGFPDSNELNGKHYYYYGNKKVSKKTFNSHCVKGNFKTICGTMSYSKMKSNLKAKGAK